MKRFFIALLAFASLAICPQSFAQQPELTIPIPDLADGAIPFVLVRIPAGTFVMGTPLDQDERWPEEFPPHQVTISKDFYLGKYEVTQAQWRAITGGRPSRYEFNLSLNHPVESVSFANIEDFFEDCVDLGVGEFRLPTEAEWEYACGAGATTPYFWGETREGINNYAWYYSNSEGRHKPVGTKLPNPWGLFNMTGNVYELVFDKWRDGFERDAQVDPVVDRDTRFHVIKGGGFRGNEHRTRPAWRYFTEDSRRNYNIGFRIAMDVEDAEAAQTAIENWRSHE